jgi:glycosyltransferase involved in cell wall biosynthesis
VVDGGSEDGTVEIIRRYADDSSKVLKFEPASLEATPRQGSSNVEEVRSQRTEDGGQSGERGEVLKFESSKVLKCEKEKSQQVDKLNQKNFSTLELSNFRTALIWLSEPDQGMYDAINKGIRMATGDVIGILNADDFLADNSVIERVANEFTNIRLREYDSGGQAKIDVVYGDVRFVKECANAEPSQVSSFKFPVSNNELASLRSAKTLRYYSAKRWKPWMLQWGYMPPHPGVYIRRECFERLGYYKLGYHIAADYELLIRYLHKGGLTMRYLDACIVGMRPGGKSTKNWRSNLLLNQEIVRGNRENGYFCCMLMLAPKYVFKIFEFIVPWVKGKMRSELVL